ncbi:hypothetical protein EZV62_024844 [Acer yangbiense]|uniref:PsbP C-terminal domain-containing protein n=1 Tax=Acer yangbiense TaxID=1000413 RepID=A0A5C7GWR4_9ROSI|nr:hypothetical protein EZV62_024844 [Acer yangbiense]
MALQHYLHLQAYKSASLHRIYMTQSSDSNDRKESFQQVGSPAEEFAPLAATFRRRLLVGIGSASLVAVGANFGGITSFLIGLSPESGRNLKLDVLYPIGGYSRCIDTNEGFEFVYPASWVGDQTLLYRAAKKTEFQRSLDPPPLNKVKSKKLNVNEPVVAFGPPGSSGELNVSVIVSPVPLDFSIEAFGDAKQVGESIVKKITGSGGVKGSLIKSSVREDLDPPCSAPYKEITGFNENPLVHVKNISVFCCCSGNLYCLAVERPKQSTCIFCFEFLYLANSMALDSKH